MRYTFFAAVSLVCAAFVFASCGGQNSKRSTDASTTDSLMEIYAMPSMPGMITEPEQRAQWAGQHFWDNFRWADTTLVGSRKSYTEQAFVDYVQLLRNMPQNLVGQSVGTLFKKAAAEKPMFLCMAEVAEKYLYDANSPYRDDEYYIVALQAVLANPALDQWERIRPEGQLKLCLKNRVGHPANDFRYTVASGATNSLYGLKAPFTLIFFNNPGCPSCAQTLEALRQSQYITALVAEGTLAILAVYPDEDLTAWREYAGEFPANWINGYDKTMAIKNGELYDLKAIPTMYLLDREKKVLLKDVLALAAIEQTIYNDVMTNE